MRTVDRPCTVSAKDGLVLFECAGAIASFEPAVAERAGDYLRRRAAEDVTPREIAAALAAFAKRTGAQLIDGAAEATRQRGRSSNRLAAKITD